MWFQMSPYRALANHLVAHRTLMFRCMSCHVLFQFVDFLVTNRTNGFYTLTGLASVENFLPWSFETTGFLFRAVQPFIFVPRRGFHGILRNSIQKHERIWKTGEKWFQLDVNFELSNSTHMLASALKISTIDGSASWTQTKSSVSSGSTLIVESKGMKFASVESIVRRKIVTLWKVARNLTHNS